MNADLKVKPPAWFWIVSVLALLWNLMGVYAYLYEAYEKDAVMAAYSEVQRAVFENRPAWVVGAFAIAVFGGALACVALLLRKKWAKPLFWISIIALVARTCYYFFMTNATEVIDLFQGTIFPIILILIAGMLIIFSKIGIDRKWLT